jgi:RNA polymerase sigma factor (sigma-70 family)
MQNTRTDFLLQFKKNSVSRQPWGQFQVIYGQVIKGYAMKIGMSSSQSDDILQETLIAMTNILPRFEYDPQKGKFRNFLLTVVHRKALAVMRKTQREKCVSLEEKNTDHRTGELEDETSAIIEKKHEEYWQECIMGKAMELLLLDPNIEPKSLDVFMDNAMSGMSPKSVAEKYQITENAVYQIKNRMIKRLRHISDGLMAGEPELYE